MWFVWTVFLLSTLGRHSQADSAVKCGRQLIRTRDLIVNGYTTFAGQFPWHVALYHRTSVAFLAYACGGSLISETFVLTAAHCVMDGNSEMNTRRLVVYLGLHDRDVFNEAMFQQRFVLEVHTVSGEPWAKLRNDIALLELRSRARYTDYVQPVCVAALEVHPGTVGVVAGWGYTEAEDLSQVLKSSSMPIVRTIDCLMSDRDTFGHSLDSGMICAGYLNGTTVSQGDSGGGLIAELADDTWFLVGIVSFGARSSAGYGVFVDVQVYIAWIRNVTGKLFNEHESLSSRSPLISSLKVRKEELESFPSTTPSSAEEIILADGECGQRRVELKHPFSPKLDIIDLKRGLWPWHGTLHRNDGKSNYFSYLCGVTILTNKFVVTAKYCISSKKPVNKRIKYYVLLGQINLSQIDEKHQKRNVVQIHANIAIILIELEAPMIFTKYVQPICLWSSSSSSNEVTIQTGFIAGYGGKDLFRKVYLEEHQLTFVPKSNCNIEADDNQLLCANFSNSKPNEWDAGGGLVILDADKWFLLGVFSNDPTLVRENQYVILLDIAFSLDWIESILKQ